MITSFNVPGVVSGTNSVSINSTGAVTGNYTDSARLVHGYVRDSLGNFTTFDAPDSGMGTYPVSINASGQITGYVLTNDLKLLGFYRDAVGVISLLNFPDAIAVAPAKINAAGVIAGFNTDTSNHTHGFLLKP